MNSITVNDSGCLVTSFTDEQRSEAALLLEQVSSGDILFSYNEGESKHYVDVFSILAKLGIQIGGGDWYAAAHAVIKDELSRQEQPQADEDPFKNELPDWVVNGLEGTITIRS